MTCPRASPANTHDPITYPFAVVAGRDRPEVRAFLAGDAGTQEVRESQREAEELGIGGVPFYVVDGRYAVSGGQPAEVWLRTLDAVEAERVS